MSVSEPPQPGVAVAGETVSGPATGAPALSEPGVPVAPHVHSEFLHFALRNWKFVAGATIVLACLLVALVGPLLTANAPLAFTGPTDQPPRQVAGERPGRITQQMGRAALTRFAKRQNRPVADPFAEPVAA